MNQKKPCILIVDDMPTNVEILGAALESEYDVHFATSGEEALDVATRNPPQLILLDIMMPGMDGYETCRRIRTNPLLAETPVIFVTALETADAELRGLTQGAEDYIVKPFNVELTRLRVRNLIERRRNQARLALALRCAGEGLWEWDLGNGQIEFDTQWASPLGYAPGEMRPNVLDWQSIVHREDLPRIFDMAASIESDLSVEVRMRNKDDGWTWVQLIGKISERGENGVPLRVSGAYLDVSRRKQAEEAVLERERRLAVLLASLQDSLFVLDTGGHILSHHLAGAAGSRFAPAIAAGRDYSTVFDASIVGQLDQAIATVVMTLQPSHFECSLPQADKACHYKVTVSALADSRHQPTGFMVLARDISDIKEAQEEIRQLAFIDPLTQLPNRRLLMERLHKALLDCRRNESFGALLFVDLDNFKQINDRYGHDCGDELLIQVARRLRSSVRSNDTVSRLGGDEFVILLENLGHSPETAGDNARKLADSMLQNLNAAFEFDELQHTVTPSIGATLFSGHNANSETLIRQADDAMYAAKSAGKNQISFSTASLS